MNESGFLRGRDITHELFGCGEGFGGGGTVDAEPHLEEVIHGNERGLVAMEIMPHLRQEGVRKMGGGTG
jgi:hypothetical protein